MHGLWSGEQSLWLKLMSHYLDNGQNRARHGWMKSVSDANRRNSSEFVMVCCGHLGSSFVLPSQGQKNRDRGQRLFWATIFPCQTCHVHALVSFSSCPILWREIIWKQLKGCAGQCNWTHFFSDRNCVRNYFLRQKKGKPREESFGRAENWVLCLSCGWSKNKKELCRRKGTQHDSNLFRRGVSKFCLTQEENRQNWTKLRTGSSFCVQGKKWMRMQE